jgi:hypothetical protein
MASHEQLAQFGRSPSTASDDDDASTSSEDVNGVLAGPLSNSMMSVEPDQELGTASDAMQLDSPNSTSKPRLKLKLRACFTSLASAEGALPGHGVKQVASGGVDENKKPPSTPLIANKSPTRLSPVVASVPVKIEDDGYLPHADARGEKNVTVVKNSHSRQGTVVNGEKKKDSAVSPGVKPKPLKAEKTNAVSVAEHAGSGSSGKIGEAPHKAKAPKMATAISEGKAKAKNETKIKIKVPGAVNGTTKSYSVSASSDPPRTKQKLPKLPLSTKRKLPLKGGDASATSAAVVKATVVAGDDLVEADAIATVVEVAPVKSAAPPAKAPPSIATKKKPQQPGKPIRLPPLTSPGLLIPQATAGVTETMVNPEGFASPEAVFEQAMALAGYTLEARTHEPHRGSSVQRVVGDMFDTNVVLALNFPTLVPKNLWSRKTKRKGDNAEAKPSLPLLLLKSLGNHEQRSIQTGEQEEVTSKENWSRKRQRPCQAADMLPISLSVPFPESYMQSRLKFVKEVRERERAIVLQQESQERLEKATEEKELISGTEEASLLKTESPVLIPPLPTPPSPPLLSEFTGFDADQYEGTHPFYQPKGKKNLLAHLDRNCFHVVEGRYFGLISNFVADPHFVGANAPGISGLTLSVGSGLATISTNSGSGVHVTAASSILAAHPAPAPSSSKSSSKTAPGSSDGPSADKITPKKEPASTAKPSKKTTATLPTLAKSGATGKFKLKHMGPTPTASAADLRKVMEGSQGSELVENMRTCIIRAAVHASRSGKHGQSFLAPDGKAYPDVSKAFAAHAGLKPCSRCKNNKQGVSCIIANLA